MAYTQASRPTQAHDMVRPRPLIGTAVRFGATGAAGVAVNTLALHLLYGVAGLPLLVAAPLSVEVGIVHNYVLNDRWTFEQRRPSLRRFARFNASALVTLLVNVALVWLLVVLGIHYLVANIVGIAAGSVLNFGATTTWVWPRGTT